MKTKHWCWCSSCQHDLHLTLSPPPPPPLCLSVSLCLCLSLPVSVCLPVCLPLSLSVCLSLSLSASAWHVAEVYVWYIVSACIQLYMLLKQQTDPPSNSTVISGRERRRRRRRRRRKAYWWARKLSFGVVSSARECTRRLHSDTTSFNFASKFNGKHSQSAWNVGQCPLPEGTAVTGKCLGLHACSGCTH